jgi:hypothetical protein
MVMSQHPARHDTHAKSQNEDVDDIRARQPERGQPERGQPEHGQPDEDEYELIGDNDLGAADLGPLGPNAHDPDAGSGRMRKITRESGR